MTTANLGMTKPTVGADADNWGTELNANLDLIDARLPKIGFSAYLNSAPQSVPNAAATKIHLDGEEFDVGGYFDSTTNYRFLPAVAGYYQFSWRVQMPGLPATAFVIASLYKNGAVFKRGNAFNASVASSEADPTGSALVYFNGTTDYVELYVSQLTTGTVNVTNGADYTYLTGFLVFPS